MPDVWMFKIKQVTKAGDKVNIVVTTYINDKEFAGREMSWEYDECKDLTTEQFLVKIKEQVKYIVQQDNEEYLLKKKLALSMDTEISVE